MSMSRRGLKGRLLSPLNAALLHLLPSIGAAAAVLRLHGFIVESRPVNCRTASLAAARVAWPRALDANADSPPPTPKTDIPLVAVSAVNLPAATPPPRIRPVRGSTIWRSIPTDPVLRILVSLYVGSAAEMAAPAYPAPGTPATAPTMPNTVPAKPSDAPLLFSPASATSL